MYFGVTVCAFFMYFSVAECILVCAKMNANHQSEDYFSVSKCFLFLCCCGLMHIGTKKINANHNSEDSHQIVINITSKFQSTHGPHSKCVVSMDSLFPKNCNAWVLGHNNIKKYLKNLSKQLNIKNTLNLNKHKMIIHILLNCITNIYRNMKNQLVSTHKISDKQIINEKCSGYHS